MKRRNWYGNPSPMTDDDWRDFWDFVGFMNAMSPLPGMT